MKKVLILSSTLDGNKTIMTSATNWAQLKSQMASEGVDANGLKAVIQQTKVTLEQDAAELPNHDFTLVLTPGKIKSGN